ncbi:MAG: DNA topoisomerase IV subunit A [Lentisphaerae bacterium]|nr:DNA topoisomerase IV subunit A [Lentisphaerota bacterium]
MAEKKKKSKEIPQEQIAPEEVVQTPDVENAEAAVVEEEEDSTTAMAETVKGNNELLRKMMGENFIEYASYVIKERAIPDVDDGLKPVQRRILWTMHKIDDGTFQKVANIVGETMKYHPHGDASIYDALVVVANKELFIEKQGNYGNIVTGDPSAAARYIEARLSKLGKEVLFNDGITELIDSYDGRNKEPVRLPIKIPALLLMGSDGIAVGTNTKIMSHNFVELLNAQIAVLKEEEFQLFPDFLQGGIMDASQYEDGNGKITLRAKIELDGRTLIIKEIPAFTTTGKLMDSIEKAANKGKIKIASIHDLTSSEVRIEIIPQRGYDPQRAIQALYQYTDCSLSVSLNLMVIKENRPSRMTVTEVVKRNTEKLLEYLRYELNIEVGKSLDKLLVRTLAQIFVEERIYKKIENCKTYEAIEKEVRAGLEKYRSEWEPLLQQLVQNLRDRGLDHPTDPDEALRFSQLEQGIIPIVEIERLLAIPIRRISLFDINQNKKDMAEISKQLEEAQKNLKRLKAYAIKYLQRLIDEYGEFFPRRTEIRQAAFDKIDVSAIALNNIRVGWDRKNCYVGTSVKSDDVVVCNEVDHLLCVERKGSYKVIAIPDKVFIDRLYEFRKYDKNTVFGIVYSDNKTGKVYYKRSCISQFIRDKEYRIIPEKCRLELITSRPNAIYECKIDTPIKARQTQEIDLSKAPLRSPKAGGQLLFPRKMTKITFVKYLDGTEEPENPELINVPPDPVPVPPEPEEVEETPAVSEEKPQEKPVKKAPVKKKEETPEPESETETESVENQEDVKDEKPVVPETEDDNWGISQMDFGF